MVFSGNRHMAMDACWMEHKNRMIRAGAGPKGSESLSGAEWSFTAGN